MRKTWIGLALGALALFTFLHHGSFRNEFELWETPDTVRAHINARQAALDRGRIDEALEECRWLLRAVEREQVSDPQDVRNIHRICLRVSSRSVP